MNQNINTLKIVFNKSSWIFSRLILLFEMTDKLGPKGPKEKTVETNVNNEYTKPNII